MRPAALRGAGITHVLTTGEHLEELIPHDEGLTYLSLSVCDTPDQKLEHLLPEAAAFITEGREAGGVLVHCFQGKSRCVSFVCAYLLLNRLEDSFESALDTVRLSRPSASPNLGFALELRKLERSCTKG
ncbi:unnamed protein product [Chrysoparadoxa australica]